MLVVVPARQLEKIVCLQNDFHNMPMVLRLHNVHTSTNNVHVFLHVV